jgi:hypothetical protein
MRLLSHEGVGIRIKLLRIDATNWNVSPAASIISGETPISNQRPIDGSQPHVVFGLIGGCLLQYIMCALQGQYKQDYDHSVTLDSDSQDQLAAAIDGCSFLTCSLTLN